MANYQDDEEELLIPPDNFAMVEPGIYRSGFPSKKNFPFLKTLNLRTILYLCPEEYPETNLAFLTGIHVQLLQYGVAGNKEPFLEIPHGIISEALVQILDVRNHPLLIHCNKGKHRTGCMIGVLHKVLGWSLASIFEEYRVFSAPKERFVDQQFIECWEMTLPPTHTLYRIHQRRNSRTDAAGADSRWFDSSLTPGLADEKSAYLVNPEVNEHLMRKEKEREIKNAAAAAARSDPPATTSHASLQHAFSERNTSTLLVAANASVPSAAVPILTRPLHHQHTQSQPNLGAFSNARQQ